MTPDELMQLLRRKPFQPLRIVQSDGKTYDIHHPDNVFVLRARVDIGVRADANSGIIDRVEYLALSHILRIDELAVPTVPTSNGQSA